MPFSLAMICFAGFRAFSVVANFLLSQWTEDPLLNNHSAWGSQVFVDTNHSYLLYYGLTGAAQCKYKFYCCSVFASGDLRNVSFDMSVYFFSSQTFLNFIERRYWHKQISVHACSVHLFSSGATDDLQLLLLDTHGLCWAGPPQRSHQQVVSGANGVLRHHAHRPHHQPRVQGHRNSE